MRRRCVLAFVLVVMATVSVVGWGPALAPAQETGGLPSVDARVKTLEALVAGLQSSVNSLKAADTALQNALSQETAARSAADAALQTALNGEASARSTRDNALQSSIDGLQSAINTEKAARQAADQQLQSAIGASAPKVFYSFKQDTFLVNGEPGAVGRVGPLPAGHYVVIAKANVQNQDHTVQWLCGLHLDNGQAVDSTDTHTLSHGALDSRAISLGHDTNVTALVLSSPSSVTLLCQTGEPSSLLSWVQMVAIQVGDITTNP